MSKGRLLLTLARAAIARQLNIPFAEVDASNESWLQNDGACFVTLHKQGELRGCIGTLSAHRSLLEDVQANAINAAFHDPRFFPLSADEFTEVDVEVSILTEAMPMPFSDEADALAQLRPHIDGVIFRYENHRATFLPQVWEQLPSPELFMAHLKQKAGLPAGFWADGVQILRYQVEKFSEEHGRAGEVDDD